MKLHRILTSVLGLLLCITCVPIFATDTERILLSCDKAELEMVVENRSVGFKSNNEKIEVIKNEMGYEISILLQKDEEVKLSFDSAEIDLYDDNSMMINKNGVSVAALSSFKDENNVKANCSVKNDSITLSAVTNGEYKVQLYGVNDYSNWFNSSSWITRDEGISLSINHKNWAFAGIETGPISWSWNTLFSKHQNDAQWKNAQGIKEQYMCHVNFAANKNPWNLEPWRSQVGYNETVACSCNP